MKLHKYDVTSETPLERIPNAASTAFTVGQALVLASGKAAACGATDVPEYLCMKESPAADTDDLPVIRVNGGMVLEAELSAAGASLKAGDKVTLAADGVRVTATTTKGVFEITGFATDAQAAGDLVYGRLTGANASVAG